VTTLAPSDLDPVDVITATPEAMAWHIDIEWFNPLWPSQRELLALLRAERKVMFLKARQLRFTWSLALWSLWMLIDQPAIAGAYVSIGKRESEDVTRRVMRLHACLPDMVRDRYPLSAESLSRVAIGHREGESELISLPSSSTAGRGKTLAFLIGDERPKWPHPEEQEASLLPAVRPDGMIVMGGTANGFDSFQARWTNHEALGYATIFSGALSDPARTIEWVMTEREGLGDLGPQEYPLTAEEAFLSSGRCAFDLSSLAWYTGNATEPAKWRGYLQRDAAFIAPVEQPSGDWWVWEWPTAGRDYVIVADTSGGHSADYSAASVIDIESWDEVASYHAKVEPSVLASELVKAGILWSGPSAPALLVPEANNHGAGVIALLREWNYPRLYRTERLDREGKPATTYGWLTTDQSRHLAIASLQRGLNQQTLGIRDEAAIAEMRRFIWVTTNDVTGAGRFQADESANDDRVMKWAIAAGVLANAEQLVAQRPAQAVAEYEPRVSSRTGY